MKSSPAVPVIGVVAGVAPQLVARAVDAGDGQVTVAVLPPASV